MMKLTIPLNSQRKVVCTARCNFNNWRSWHPHSCTFQSSYKRKIKQYCHIIKWCRHGSLGFILHRKICNIFRLGMASVIIPDTSEYYVGETGCKFLLCTVKCTYFNRGMTNKVVTKNRCNKSKAGYIFTRLSFNC